MLPLVWRSPTFYGPFIFSIGPLLSSYICCLPLWFDVVKKAYLLDPKSDKTKISRPINVTTLRLVWLTLLTRTPTGIEEHMGLNVSVEKSKICIKVLRVFLVSAIQYTFAFIDTFWIGVIGNHPKVAGKDVQSLDLRSYISYPLSHISHLTRLLKTGFQTARRLRFSISKTA